MLSILVHTAFAASAFEIHNAIELISFSNMVQGGKYFENETVRLVNDIEFTKELSNMFNPVGTDYNNFRGSFDGQGHVIKGLNFTSSRKNVGLFGYMEKGALIRNIVLDSTCSFMSNYSQDPTRAYVGGIIGYCYDKTRKCTIENTINLGTVGFSGILNNYLYTGSIVGECFAETYGCVIRNNANYGLLYHTGSSKHTEMGGIIGYCYVPSTIANVKCKLVNNLNSGMIKHEGETTLTLEVGGIVGMLYGVIENCVYAGTIESNQNKNFFGGIIGYLDDTSIVSNCYWSAESGLNLYDLKYGFPVIKDSVKFDSDFLFGEQLTIGNYTGKSFLSAVNAYTEKWKLYDYSGWLLNRDSVNVSFSINGARIFSSSEQVIMLPAMLNDEELWFNGWYTNIILSEPLTNHEITDDTSLYSSFGKSKLRYTITFDTRGGSFLMPITKEYHALVQLPKTGFSRMDYVFVRWENDYGDTMPWNFTMPSHDMTLHAVWLPVYIRTPEVLIELSNKIRAWETYEGLTVYLGSDLDFSNASNKFLPIGDQDNWFNGTFNGQGHVISNLNVKSSMWYFGIFGYSGNGVTIRNIVLDESSSFECDAKVTAIRDRYVSGIIGNCFSETIPCIIENNINLASIRFTGNITGVMYKFLYMGPIVGVCTGTCTIRNNVNYGSVEQSGVTGVSRVGGITGYCRGRYGLCYIRNNLNYGPLIHNGNTTYINIGGIASYVWGSCTVEACVNAGNITINELNFTTRNVGSIIGSSYDSTDIKLCFWDESIDIEPVSYMSDKTNVSDMRSFDSEFDLNGNVTVKNRTAETLMDALNTYAYAEKVSTWVLNRGSHSIHFRVNARNLVTLNSEVILLPDLANEGSKAWFDGWYTDSKYTTPLKTTEMTHDTTLYALWINNGRKGSSSSSSSSSLDDYSSSSSFAFEIIPNIVSVILLALIH